MNTFASSIAISAGSRIALGAMVDVVAALLGYYAAKSAKVEDRAQKRKLWSDTLLMGGMLGLRMMPWLTSGLYSPIARATTRTPSDAVYDSIYAPSMSSMKTPNATVSPPCRCRASLVRCCCALMSASFFMWTAVFCCAVDICCRYGTSPSMPGSGS
jgi:hypothetical protein